MPRPCQVTFQDLDGIRHTVAVEADSVYESCVLALRALQKAGFVNLQPGPASTLQVQLLEPSVTHQVNVGPVQPPNDRPRLQTTAATPYRRGRAAGRPPRHESCYSPHRGWDRTVPNRRTTACELG